MTPISVLISKKDGRLYVRQALAPIFDAPITVRDPETPLGSHLYIATAPSSDGTSLKWTVLTMPAPSVYEPESRRTGKAAASETVGTLTPRRYPSGAAEALERVEIAQEIRDRIAERLWTGGSIIISDQPPSSETGAVGTDLTVRAR